MLLTLCVAASLVRGDSAIPPHLAARVRDEIAARWAVDTTALRLEWGSFGPADSMLDVAPFRLEGGSREGWFAVIITPPHEALRAVRVHAGVMRSTSVAAHAMGVGHRLAAEDMRTGEAIAWGPPDSARTLNLLGWEVRAARAAGDPLVPPAVAPPLVIGLGDSVTVRWIGAGIAVERGAVAAQSARLGDRVRLRVGKTEVMARATGTEIAQVNGGDR